MQMLTIKVVSFPLRIFAMLAVTLLSAGYHSFNHITLDRWSKHLAHRFIALQLIESRKQKVSW